MSVNLVLSMRYWSFRGGGFIRSSFGSAFCRHWVRCEFSGFHFGLYLVTVFVVLSCRGVFRVSAAVRWQRCFDSSYASSSSRWSWRDYGQRIAMTMASWTRSMADSARFSCMCVFGFANLVTKSSILVRTIYTQIHGFNLSGPLP